MPFYDPREVPVTDIQPPEPLIPVTDIVAEKPSTSEALGAAFRSENIVGSFLADNTRGIDNTPDPAFSLADEIIGTKYEGNWDRLLDANNKKYLDAMRAQIDQEEDDRRTLHAAGWAGGLATLGAGIVDLPTLIPGGALVKGAKGGYSVAKSALALGAAGAVDAGASEAALHSTQVTRTATDSAVNIGASVVLSSMLGAGVAKYLGSRDISELTSRLDADINRTTDVSADDMEVAGRSYVSNAQSAGAAAVDKVSLDDLTLSGKAARRIAAAAPFNPLLRLIQSPSKRAREILLDVVENPLYLKRTMEGRNERAGAETSIKEFTQGALGRAIKSQDEIYSAMKKAGTTMSRDNFRESVGRAMRRGDVDPSNEHVTQAAQAWRRDVFDPLKERAIKAGLLPEDVSVETATSYLSRVYNRGMIEAQESRFKDIVRRWADDVISNTEMTNGQQFANQSDRIDYLSEVVDSIYNKITGREVVDTPYNIVANTRGPLKERTFNIADSEIEDFLVSDVEAIGRRYSRLMAADVELTERFGKADMADAISDVQREYADLRKGVKDEAQLKRLNARERADVRDIKGVRDLLRGTYKIDENLSGFGRIVQAANTFNYIRAMGGVVMSSLPDVARPMMVHGLRGFFGDGIAPMVKNLKAVRLSVQEARLAGTVAERILNTRMATWAELTDPYSISSPFERFLHNTATGFSKLNGMVYWNDYMKSFTSVMTQNRILRNADNLASLSKKERAYMAYLGVGEDMGRRVNKMFKEHGELVDGVYVANTDAWTDAAARSAYRAAVNKDVDSIIITKGIADTPLFANTPLGRSLLQFKSFALATHQRAFLRGMQEGSAGMLSGLLSSSIMGMFVYWLKSIESNRETSNNPGKWVAEGIDRSGILSVMMEVNNTAEKWGAPGIYTALQGMFPDKDQKAPASRYAIRSNVGSLLGPSFGLATDISQIGGVVTGGGDMKPSDVNAARRLMPGSTLPVMRSLLEYYALPAAREAVE